jgi:CubicO group peptidase (beta-lactamase class C family)
VVAGVTWPAHVLAQSAPATERLHTILDRAAELPRLHALVVAQDGVILAERRFRGPGLDVPVNIKSISKSILSALVGIAIGEGKLEGVNQPIAPFFARYLRDNPDPALRQITIEHLLSMRSGLSRTSGPSYGPWVRSRDWVGFILRQPMVAGARSAAVRLIGNRKVLFRCMS